MPGAFEPLGPGWQPRVDRVAEAFALALDPGARGRIAGWLDLLATWNARIDLTAARGPDEAVDLMLADAFALVPSVREGSKVVDVGTGAGAPGLALALVRPDLAVTLVEPLQKRVAFLRTVVGTLALDRVEVVRGKGDELLRSRPAAFDVAMSRATLAPPLWLALGAKLAAPDGTVIVMLAREPPPELAGLRVVSDRSYVWPLTGAERRVVAYSPT